MKKFLTTDKHEVFMQGILIENNEIGEIVADEDYGLTGLSIDDLNYWLEKGWIEEFQEPKYTDNQLQKLCVKFANDNMRIGHLSGRYTIEAFNKWRLKLKGFETELKELI